MIDKWITGYRYEGMAKQEARFWPAYLNIVIWNDCWEMQRTDYEQGEANGSFVIIRPEQCDYLVRRRCNRLVWPHCQTWFHLHHLVSNDSSAPLMRRAGLVQPRKLERRPDRPTNRPGWLNDTFLPGAWFLRQRVARLMCLGEGEETQIFSRWVAEDN